MLAPAAERGVGQAGGVGHSDEDPAGRHRRPWTLCWRPIVRLTATRLAIAGVSLLLGVSLDAEAQETRKIPRVGIVGATSPAVGRTSMEAFRVGLRELGYIEGQSILVEERWAEGRLEGFGDLIADLLRSNVDVIVVASAGGARAAKKAVTTTPVVFVAVTDPVGNEIVSSLARPGGNLTGTSLVIGEQFAGKWVELARDAQPRVSSVAALSHMDHPMATKYVTAMRAAARRLGLTLQVFDVRDVVSLDSALSAIAKAPPGALIVPASALFGFHRKRIADFALPRGIPTVGHDRSLVVDGILMSYGPSIMESYRRGAVYVDRILRGAKPADLPVEQPTKFELVVNLRTARALGLTMPPALLLRADHVID